MSSRGFSSLTEGIGGKTMLVKEITVQRRQMDEYLLSDPRELLKAEYLGGGYWRLVFA